MDYTLLVHSTHARVVTYLLIVAGVELLMSMSLWGVLPEHAMAYRSRCHVPATNAHSY